MPCRDDPLQATFPQKQIYGHIHCTASLTWRAACHLVYCWLNSRRAPAVSRSKPSALRTAHREASAAHSGSPLVAQDSPLFLPACPPGLRFPRPRLPPGSCWRHWLHLLEQHRQGESWAEMYMIKQAWWIFPGLWCELGTVEGPREEWGRGSAAPAPGEPGYAVRANLVGGLDPPATPGRIWESSGQRPFPVRTRSKLLAQTPVELFTGHLAQNRITTFTVTSWPTLGFVTRQSRLLPFILL